MIKSMCVSDEISRDSSLLEIVARSLRENRVFRLKRYLARIDEEVVRNFVSKYSEFLLQGVIISAGNGVPVFEIWLQYGINVNTKLKIVCKDEVSYVNIVWMAARYGSCEILKMALNALSESLRTEALLVKCSVCGETPLLACTRCPKNIACYLLLRKHEQQQQQRKVERLEKNQYDGFSERTTSLSAAKNIYGRNILMLASKAKFNITIVATILSNEEPSDVKKLVYAVDALGHDITYFVQNKYTCNEILDFLSQYGSPKSKAKESVQLTNLLLNKAINCYYSLRYWIYPFSPLLAGCNENDYFNILKDEISELIVSIFINSRAAKLTLPESCDEVGYNVLTSTALKERLQLILSKEQKMQNCNDNKCLLNGRPKRYIETMSCDELNFNEPTQPNMMVNDDKSHFSETQMKLYSLILCERYLGYLSPQFVCIHSLRGLFEEFIFQHNNYGIVTSSCENWNKAFQVLLIPFVQLIRNELENVFYCFNQRKTKNASLRLAKRKKVCPNSNQRQKYILQRVYKAFIKLNIMLNTKLRNRCFISVRNLSIAYSSLENLDNPERVLMNNKTTVGLCSTFLVELVKCYTTIINAYHMLSSSERFNEKIFHIRCRASRFALDSFYTLEQYFACIRRVECHEALRNVYKDCYLRQHHEDTQYTALPLHYLLQDQVRCYGIRMYTYANRRRASKALHSITETFLEFGLDTQLTDENGNTLLHLVLNEHKILRDTVISLFDATRDIDVYGKGLVGSRKREVWYEEDEKKTCFRPTDILSKLNIVSKEEIFAHITLKCIAARACALLCYNTGNYITPLERLPNYLRGIVRQHDRDYCFRRYQLNRLCKLHFTLY